MADETESKTVTEAKAESRRPSAIVAEKTLSERHEIERTEVESFINTLETRVNALMASCQMLQDKGLAVQIKDFLEFQDLTTENLTFLIIIERRLEKLPQRHKSELHDNFYDLVVAVWSIVMRGALSFLTTISQDDYLPLGSREMFLRELKTLHDAQMKLREERYQSRIGHDITKEMQKAERILSEVIEKAPTLLTF